MMESLPAISVIVNFVLLAVVLIFVSRKPLASFLHERSETIRKNVEESEKLRAEAFSLVQSYQKKLDALQSEVATLLKEAKAEGEREKKAIIDRAERLSSQIIDNAKNSVEREVEKQKSKLEQELMAKVVAEALAILKQKASEKDHEQFTEAFIQQMEKGHGKFN